MDKVSRYLAIARHASYRDYFGYGMVAANMAVVGGYLSIHSVFVEKYKNIIRLYRNGFDVKLTDSMEDFADQVTEDMKINELQGLMTKFFFVFGFETTHLGGYELRNGIHVGIPFNLTYQSVQDVERSLITLNYKGRSGIHSIKWDSDAGRSLVDSFILSDKAKQFAIGREIAYGTTYKPFFIPLAACAGIATTYYLSKAINNVYGLHFKPLYVRMGLYGVMSFFCWNICSTAIDTLHNYYDQKADKYTQIGGRAYLEGGVEFYRKIIQRNVALRELMGADGEEMFTAKGNMNEMFRQRHMPYSARLDNMTKLLKEFVEKPVEEKPVENNKSQEVQISVDDLMKMHNKPFFQLPEAFRGFR